MLWTTQTAGLETVTGGDTSTSDAILATGGAANTKGSWAQMIASTPYNTYAFTVADRQAKQSTTTNHGALFDIGVGGSGSERVIIPNLVSGFNSGVVTHFAPLFIPAGSRIAIRGQGAQASVTFSGILMMTSTPTQPTTVVATDYGTSTAGSGGTALFTGTLAAHTKSSWTQIVSATTASIKYLLVMPNGANSGTWDDTRALLDIGIGGSGSEVVVMSNLPVRLTTGPISFTPSSGAWLEIPTGTRIAARYQRSTANPAVAPRVSVIGFG